MSKGEQELLPDGWNELEPREPVAQSIDEPPGEEWIAEFAAHVPTIPAFPICHRKNMPGGAIEADTDNLGTAFFVAPHGIFITAGHVVENDGDVNHSLSILLHNGTDAAWVKVAAVAMHPSIDAAIGYIDITSKPPILRLGTDELPANEPIAMYGYSRTKSRKLHRDDRDLPALLVSFLPRFYRGCIDAHYPGGFGLTKWPVYVHTAQSLGGISGGPMIRISNGAIYGLLSSGSEQYGVATDIRHLLDWPIPFLSGLSLRALVTSP